MIDNERRKKLIQSMKNFNKSQKSEVFVFGNEIVDSECIPSGIESIDKFIGGGFKKSSHAIIWGQYSVGKTALILTTIAHAQANGELVCYVNTEKPINKERFEFFGINLNDMVYIESPSNAEQALSAMRTLCKDKTINLFIIDSTNGLCPASVQETKEGGERSLEKKNVAALALTLSNFYNIVNSDVFRSRAAVIWIGQARTKGIGSYFVHQGLSCGQAQEFYAYQIIYMRKGQKSNNPINKVKHYSLDENKKLRYKTEDEECGFSVILKLEKTNSSKSAKENSSIEIPYLYSKGFVNNFVPEETFVIDGTDEEKDIITKMLVEKGIIKESAEEVVVNDIPVVPENNEEPKKRGRKAKEQK